MLLLEALRGSHSCSCLTVNSEIPKMQSFQASSGDQKSLLSSLGSYGQQGKCGQNWQVTAIILSLLRHGSFLRPPKFFLPFMLVQHKSVYKLPAE